MVIANAEEKIAVKKKSDQSKASAGVLALVQLEQVCLLIFRNFRCHELLLHDHKNKAHQQIRLCRFSVGIATWTLILFVSSAIISPSPCISSVETSELSSGPTLGRIRGFCEKGKFIFDNGIVNYITKSKHIMIQ